MKKIINLFGKVVLIFVITLSSPYMAFGQTAQSNCVVTKIGDVGVQKLVLPPECKQDSGGGGIGEGGVVGDCGSVVEWAAKISDSLTEGGGGYLSGDGFDNRTQDFSSNCAESSPRSSWAGQYWCTYLVVDAYNLAGIKGLSVGNDGLVSTMHAHFRQYAGYFALDYNGGPNEEIIRKVKPGFAIFFGPIGDDDHVGLVKTISYDDKGNGFLETYESNSSAKSHKWPLSGWKVIKGSFEINGFGGYAK